MKKTCFSFLGLMVFASTSQALELTIKDAETVAIQQDPVVVHHQAHASAKMEEAVAAGSLPDPKLKFGIVNLPTTFSFTDEAMTQTKIGVQQMLPPSGLLDAQQQKLLMQAEAHRAITMGRALEVLRNLRKAWMDVYYQAEALKLVSETQQVFEQLVKITQYQYRAGRGKQHDVVRAQLELSLLEDREVQIRQDREAAIAVLEKWTGASVRNHTLSSVFPELPTLPRENELRENIAFHPLTATAKAKRAEARHKIAIARAHYKPSFMLDVSYGFRGGQNPDLTGRSDFLTAMVSMDMPFFTSKRQDRRLNARGHEMNAADDAVKNAQRELQRILDVSYANWVRLGERLAFYKKRVLPQASQFSEASRKAYQSRVSDFSELVRARVRELDANLQYLRLRVDRAKAHYDLQYLAGEAGQ